MEISEEEIDKEAYRIWQSRLKFDLPGDALSDRNEAVKRIKIRKLRERESAEEMREGVGPMA